VALDETGVEFDEDKIDRIELFYEDFPGSDNSRDC